MKINRFVIYCTFSAVLGAFLARLISSPVVPLAWAQDPAASRTQLEPGKPARIAGLRQDDSQVDYSPEELQNIRVYERGNRSVVHITTQVLEEDFFFDVIPRKGSGSGSVIDAAGHLLTNYHVIEDAQQIVATLYDGSQYQAKLVGADPVNDIAVLKIQAPRESLQPVALGDSSGLKVGQRVFAIGNPFGLERTMTVGIVSSLNRVLPTRNHRRLKSIIQIDAALNQGNSGGPLLDSGGRLIGMNTAIANPSGTGENTGVGFAIPVNTIKRVVPQLIENGRIIRPNLGITHVSQTEDGLLVRNLEQGGPADRAGLRGPRRMIRRTRLGEYIYVDPSAADLIVGIDGERVRTVDDLLTFVEGKQPGDQVTLNVVRDGSRADVPLVLGGDD